MIYKNITQTKNKPVFVSVPFAEYQELLKRLVAGENPTKLYRKYRNLTQEKLASKVNKNQAIYLRARKKSAPRHHCYFAKNS